MNRQLGPPWPRTEYHYHTYDDSIIESPWESGTISVPKICGTSHMESKTFYSLKKDMEGLCSLGKDKDIVKDDSSSEEVGTSLGKRKLLLLKVGNGSEHKVLVAGCHHAREWISVEIPYLIAEYLIMNYKKKPKNDKEKRIKHLLNNREIWFVPMVNPDGHMYTIAKNRLWRPNRSAYRLPSDLIYNNGEIEIKSETYTGVDINRNYNSTGWGNEKNKQETSKNPKDAGKNSFWCGPSANSEKETQVISKLIEDKKFRACITYHNYGQEVYYPSVSDNPDKDKFLQAIGKGMKKLIKKYEYKEMASIGDMAEYAYEKTKRPAYTIELRPEKGEDEDEQKIYGIQDKYEKLQKQIEKLQKQIEYEKSQKQIEKSQKQKQIEYEKFKESNYQGFTYLPESEIEPCFKENLPAALALINCAGHNETAGTLRRESKEGGSSQTYQVVRNCWEVFKDWWD